VHPYPHNLDEMVWKTDKFNFGRYELYEMTLQVEEFQAEMVACGQCRDPIN
jgi:hypothetical protein